MHQARRARELPGLAKARYAAMQTSGLAYRIPLPGLEGCSLLEQIADGRNQLKRQSLGRLRGRLRGRVGRGVGLGAEPWGPSVDG